MRTKNKNLEIAAATRSSDKAAISTWLERVGADISILHGLSEETANAYDVASYPTFRVLRSDGSVAGSDDAAIKAALAGG